MARITAYRASDDAVLLDRRTWLRHESNLLAEKALKERLTQIAADKFPGDPDAAANYIARANGVLKDLTMMTIRDAMDIKFDPSKEDETAPEAPAATNAEGASSTDTASTSSEDAAI